MDDEFFHRLFSLNPIYPSLETAKETQGMTKEREEQEKDKLRREKTQVGERRKLTEMKKSSSDMLFMLERDLSLARSLTELRICVQELLSVKVKR